MSARERSEGSADGLHGRTLRGDLARVRDELSGITGDARSYVGEQVDAHPLAAAGAAAGVGFLLGGGVTRHSLTLLLGVGARLAASYVGDELSDAFERGSQRASETDRRSRDPEGGRT